MAPLRIGPAVSSAFAIALPGAAQQWREVAPEEVGMSSDRLERLTHVMQACVDDGRIAVLIAIDGQVPYRRAFGNRDLEAEDPMEGDDIFRIASQTKAIVGAGILALQEQGALLVDDPVGRYPAEWMETDVAVDDDAGGVDIVPAERPITVRDLLTHTSGIPYGAWIDPLTSEAWSRAGIDGWDFASEDEPIREIVRRMAELPMVAQRGTEWIYGSNTDILGAVIEAASSQPLGTFLQQTFFDPLGMEDTHFLLRREEADRLGVVYDLSPGGTPSRAADAGAMWHQGGYVVGDGPNAAMSGGAGLLSTADDYALFLEMIRNDGVAMPADRLCCAKPARDSHGGVGDIAGHDVQARAPLLPHAELVCPQRRAA